MARLLDGLMVLDFTRVLAGPFCTMVLADLGARVIKIEPPCGDEARYYGPFVNGHSAYFASINRGKESVVLDLKNPEALNLAHGLATRADVLVENFRPSTLASLGLGYDALSKTNPGLIYASLSGFGQTGPYANRGAYDVIIQAMSGLMGITGPEGGPPTRVGASVGDTIPALFAVIGILAALNARTTSGIGCWLDLGMMDALVAIVENAMARYCATGDVPQPLGNRHSAITPFGVYSTADGYLALAAGNDVLFRRLCRVIGCPALADEPAYLTNDMRTCNVDRLTADLNEVLRHRPTAEWLGLLLDGGIPCGPVNTMADLLQDEHLRHRRMLSEVEQPGIGKMIVPGSPVKVNRFEDGVNGRHAPAFGEHTGDVLAEVLSITPAELDRLLTKRAVVWSRATETAQVELAT